MRRGFREAKSRRRHTRRTRRGRRGTSAGARTACLVGDFPGAHRAVRPRRCRPARRRPRLGRRPPRATRTARGSRRREPDALRGDPRVFVVFVVFVVCVQRGGGTGNAGTDTRRLSDERELLAPFDAKRRRARLAAPSTSALSLPPETTRVSRASRNARQVTLSVCFRNTKSRPASVAAGAAAIAGTPGSRAAFSKNACVFEKVAATSRVHVVESPTTGDAKNFVSPRASANAAPSDGRRAGAQGARLRCLYASENATCGGHAVTSSREKRACE